MQIRSFGLLTFALQALAALALPAAVVRNLRAQYPTGTLGAPAVTPAVLPLLAAKVTETCDAIGGTWITGPLRSLEGRSGLTMP